MISINSVEKVWHYLWKLLLLFVVFIVSAPTFWFLGLTSGVILSIYALYLSWRTYKSKKYVGLVICLLFSVFGIRFTAFPITHKGFTYDENHKMIWIPHKHYIWELDHVH